MTFQPTDPTRQRQMLSPRGALTMFIGLLLPSSLIAQEPEIAGKITAVTVYRNQARVVREIPIAASPELQHIRVPNLPSQLVPSSAYTESDSQTRVRSIRIESLAAKNSTDPDSDPLTVLRTEQEKLQLQLESAEHNSSVIEQDLLTLEKLVGFSADKVRQNLDRATLDVQSVTALADFTMQRRRQLAEELHQADTEIRALKKTFEDNQRQQRELNIAKNLRGYEARLAIDSPNGGWVRVTYEVGGVHWTPHYTIRSQEGEGGKREFHLQLDAAIAQNSGESWTDIDVTLATSTPATRAGRPLLTPLRIEAVASDGSGSGGQVESVSAIAPTGPSQWMDARGWQLDLALNTEAGLKQVDELTQAGQIQRDIATDADTNESDESYAVPGKISLQNHAQVQTVTILHHLLSGEMHHVVTPLLSSFAFREAKLTNTSDQNLVGGSADVYLDGQFAGRITLPPTAAGQRLVVGFGNDRQVRTRRELLSRKESIQGGNRRSELKYRLVVSNYHQHALDIQLLDRIPLAAEDGSINVSLDTSDAEKLSADPLYGRMQRPTGVLRWDLTIPPRRFGSDAYDHEYQYVVELDRQQTIVGDNLVRRMRSDLRFEKTNGGGGFGGGIFRVENSRFKQP